MTDELAPHGTQALETQAAPSLAPTAPATPSSEASESAPAPRTVFEVRDMAFYYGEFRALYGVTMDIFHNQVTALIGPSGCGKTTFLRCLNRMNDLVGGTRIDGELRFDGVDVNGPNVRPIELRRKIGMVFQKPNPFPKSIWENVAFTPRANGVPRAELAGVVEQALRAAALWDEVKDKLKQSAFTLSGGQQQRLCIARAIAVAPEVILMDEPCSALDPIATVRIEELLTDLKARYTIVIVTHNMQQAGRVSDRTAFFSTEPGKGGTLVEVDDTERIFTSPADTRTEDYVTGRFG